MQIYSQCTHEPIAISINCVKWTFVLLTFSDNFGKFIRSPLMSSRDFKIRNNSTKYILHRISCEFVAYCVLGFVHLRQSNVYMHRLNDTLATSQPLSLSFFRRSFWYPAIEHHYYDYCKIMQQWVKYYVI